MEQPNWMAARQAVKDADRNDHGRLTDRPAFEVPIAEEVFDVYCEITEGLREETPDLPRRLIDPTLLSDLEKEFGNEARFEVYPASSGRGADAYAAALEIIGRIADIGGATVALAGTARLIRSVYRRVRTRLGYRPNISLGAARYLAAADFVERFGYEDFEIVGAGDIASDPIDNSYSGEDHFWVVLSRYPDLYVYLVDSVGRTYHTGIVTQRLNRFSRFPDLAGPDGHTALADDGE